ncbi:MAG: M17 family peptidase N-terminal domain-containing protein [Myxococcota bacterium]
MSARLSVEIETCPLDQIEAELAVVGSFSDERPLRGGAGRADWRLCGLISELLASGRLSGDRGEVLLTPSFGRIRAERILWFGLGSRARYRPGSLRKLCTEAVVRAGQLGLGRLVIAPLGFTPDDFPRHAEAVLTGAAIGARRLDRALRLWLPLPEDEAEAAYWALEKATKAPDAQGVALTLARSDSSPPGGASRGPTRHGTPHATHRY